MRPFIARTFLSPGSSGNRTRPANMLKGLVTFGVGFYLGVYATQNYELPKVDDPKALYEKAMDYLDQYRKK